MDNNIKDSVYFDLIVYVTESRGNQIVVNDGFNHIEAQPSGQH